MIYDVIGDIHGHASKLIGLLTKLGYTLTYHPELGVDYYQPPEHHRAMFIGDLIDRGQQEVATLEIVFNMLDADVAGAVMGNHEYNAIAYATPDMLTPQTEETTDTRYLRTHSQPHYRQHHAFLAEIPFGSEQHSYWLQRFYELPLWIETEHACFVHACWHEDNMAVLAPLLTDNQCLTPQGIQLMGQKDSLEYEALERILKGVELSLPEGISFEDKDGTKRTHMRVKWWLENISNQQHHIVDIARATPSDLAQLPQGATIDHIDFVLTTDKPIFIGHYWLTGSPKPLSNQVVCTDYSAGGTGYLTAYQFDTNNPLPLSSANFVQFFHTTNPKV